MLLFTKTRINLLLNWSSQSQDHSVQVMVQLLWTCILGTREYSIYGLQSHWKSYLLTDLFQKPLVQSHLSLLAAFPRAPTSPPSQSNLLGMYCTHRCTKKSLSYSQEEMADRTSRLLTEKNSPHFTWSVFLFWKHSWGKQQVEAGWTPTVPLFKGIKIFAYYIVYVQKIWFHHKEGLLYLVLPWQSNWLLQLERLGTTINLKGKAVVVIQLWKFSWMWKHGFFLGPGSFTSMNLTAQSLI